MPGTGIQVDFHNVASVGDVAHAYHSSLPTGLPQAISLWRFSGVMAATRDCNVSFGRSGRTVRRPFSTDISTSSPSPICNSSSRALGIRSAWLLPQPTICVLMDAVPNVSSTIPRPFRALRWYSTLPLTPPFSRAHSFSRALYLPFLSTNGASVSSETGVEQVERASTTKAFCPLNLAALSFDVFEYIF